MFERHFVAYRRAESASAPTARPSAIRSSRIRHASTCHSAGARLKTTSLTLPWPCRYELLTGGESFRVYAGRDLVAEARGLTDAAGSAGSTRGALRRGARARTTSSYTLASSAGKAAPSSCRAPASPARRRSYRHGSRRVQRTTPMSSPCSTAPGDVHPFARPLAIRDGSSASTAACRPRHWAPRPGRRRLPIGLVLVTSYRAGARWRPRRLTAARTLLALMRHTVAARGNPAHSMPILKQAVSGGIAFAGLRGEARPLVSAVLRHVRTHNAVRAATATRSDLMYPRQSPTTHTEQLGDEASVYRLGVAGRCTPSTRPRRCVWRHV